LKFPDMKETDLSSELTSFLLWGPDEFPKVFEEMGGINFLKELAIMAKSINPKIKLTMNEDLILLDHPNSGDMFGGIYTEQLNLFFDKLKQAKELGIPLDTATIQMNIWDLDPPNYQLLNDTLKNIMDLGYGIGQPQVFISIGNESFYGDGIFEMTSPLENGETHERRQGQIAYEIMRTYLAATGEADYGIHSISKNDGPYEGNEDYSRWCILDLDGKPRYAYYMMMKALSEVIINP